MISYKRKKNSAKLRLKIDETIFENQHLDQSINLTILCNIDYCCFKIYLKNPFLH